MSARVRWVRALSLVRAALLLPLLGCASPTPELTLATPDRASFELSVYPVLLRDCGFPACHSSADRFFQVFGPGRGRLDATIDPLDPALPVEVEHSYSRTRSMIDFARPERSLLLVKPLSVSAGGAAHEGVDSLGRNVYSTKLDPGYAALAAWVLGPAAAPTTPTTPTTPLPGSMP